MPDYWQRQWKEIFFFFSLRSFPSRSVLRPSYVYSVVTSGTALKDFQVFVEGTHTHTHSSLLSHAELQGQMDSKLKGNWSSSSYRLCGDYFVCVRNASLLPGRFEFLEMSVMLYTICVREKYFTLQTFLLFYHIQLQSSYTTGVNYLGFDIRFGFKKWP